MTHFTYHGQFHIRPFIFQCFACRDLDRPADFGLISRLGQRAAVVCAPDDMWFPQQHYEQMRSALPGIEVGRLRQSRLHDGSVLCTAVAIASGSIAGYERQSLHGDDRGTS
jgi:hypothetical protein